MENDSKETSKYYIVNTSIPNYPKGTLVRLGFLSEDNILNDYHHLLFELTHLNNQLISKINGLSLNAFFSSGINRTMEVIQSITFFSLKQKRDIKLSKGDSFLVRESPSKFGQHIVGSFDLIGGYVISDNDEHFSFDVVQNIIILETLPDKTVIGEGDVIYCFDKFGLGLEKTFDEGMDLTKYDDVFIANVNMSEKNFVMSNRCLSIKDVAKVFKTAKHVNLDNGKVSQGSHLYKIAEEIIRENSRKK